ncbi:MAG: PilZ domain-containing protein [Spirochaetaceae bacterium]
MGALLLLLALWFGLLFHYHSRERRQQRAERIAAAHEAWEEHIRRLELPPSWIEVVEVLARYLRDPEEKYLLFENQHSFNHAAEAALGEGAVREDTVSALRVHLGFSVPEQGSPISTASLSPGTTVFVRPSRDRTAIRARVLAPDVRHLKLQLKPDSPRIPTGSSVQVYYRNDRGIFRIVTNVLGQEDGVLSLRHSEHISREQKRKFFRKRVSEPVRVSHDSDESEPHPTRLLDLGGGGASFVNPDGLFSAGELVRMWITSRDGSRLNLHGKVLRLSQDGGVCHIEFFSIRESVRDKIYNMIFAPPTRRTTSGE